MVAMMKSPVVCRAAPIAASMAIDRPRGDRTRSRRDPRAPRAWGGSRPAASAEDGGRRLVCPARNDGAAGRGKKSADVVAEDGRGRCGPHPSARSGQRGEMGRPGDGGEMSGAPWCFRPQVDGRDPQKAHGNQRTAETRHQRRISRTTASSSKPRAIPGNGVEGGSSPSQLLRRKAVS